MYIGRLAASVVLLIVGTVPNLAAAQGPELPPAPRLRGICPLSDGPRQGWLTFTAPGLGVRISYPQNWVPREEGSQQVAFTAGDRVMLRTRIVDTGGLDPLGWLQARVRTEEGRRCRVVALESWIGHQCFDLTGQVWTTFLLTTNRVLAVEVPATLDRGVHCAILAGIDELTRP